MNSRRPGAQSQFAFGMAQMFGATVAALLLIVTGLNAISIGAAAITTALTLTSLVLFRRR